MGEPAQSTLEYPTTRVCPLSLYKIPFPGAPLMYNVLTNVSHRVSMFLTWRVEELTHYTYYERDI